MWFPFGNSSARKYSNKIELLDKAMNTVLAHVGKRSFVEQFEVIFKEYYQIINLPQGITSELKATIIENDFPFLTRKDGMLSYTKQKARLMKRVLLLEAALIEFWTDKNHNRIMLSIIIKMAMQDELSSSYKAYSGRYKNVLEIAEAVDIYEKQKLELYKNST